jgi:hypothetical protein
MATLREKIEAERRIRALLTEGEMPAPDRIEYGFTCIRLFWNEPKVVLVIDIDKLDADGEEDDEDDDYETYGDAA